MKKIRYRWSILWNRYLLIFLGFPALICLGFALIFKLNSTQLSYSNPNKSQNLNQFLNTFFNEVCVSKGTPALISKRIDGCTYSFGIHGLVTESGGSPLHITKAISFSFLSYTDKVLRLKYKTEGVWVRNPELLPDENGVIEVDLSNYSSSDDKIALRFLPYVAYENFLIKKIDQQPDVDFSKPSPFTTWGKVLSGKMLTLEGSGGSITAGRDFASFIATSSSDSYSKLKLYFEDGRIFSTEFETYLYFSASILTSSALGELMPNSPLMKFLVSLESIIGIIWLGLLAGVAMNFAFGEDPPRRGHFTNKITAMLEQEIISKEDKYEKKILVEDYNLHLLADQMWMNYEDESS